MDMMALLAFYIVTFILFVFRMKVFDMGWNRIVHIGVILADLFPGFGIILETIVLVRALAEYNSRWGNIKLKDNKFTRFLFNRIDWNEYGKDKR